MAQKTTQCGKIITTVLLLPHRVVPQTARHFSFHGGRHGKPLQLLHIHTFYTTWYYLAHTVHYCMPVATTATPSLTDPPPASPRAAGRRNKSERTEIYLSDLSFISLFKGVCGFFYFSFS